MKMAMLKGWRKVRKMVKRMRQSRRGCLNLTGAVNRSGRLVRAMFGVGWFLRKGAKAWRPGDYVKMAQFASLKLL
jgi:hypothetical protein